MSLLHSFSFSHDEETRWNLALVWDNILNCTTEQDMEKYKDCLGEEVVDAIFANKIDPNQAFNLKAYAVTVKSNQKMANAKKAQKTLRIVNDDDDFDMHISIPAYCVPMAKLPSTEGAAAVVEYDLELQEAVDEIRRSNLRITAKSGVDVICALTVATRSSGETLKGAQDALRKVVKQFPEFGECIQTVLSSGYQIDELFPCEVKECEAFYKMQRNDLELQEVIDILRERSPEISRTTGVDIIYALITLKYNKGELAGVQDALDKVVTEFPELNDHIHMVLSSGGYIDRLFSKEVEEYKSLCEAYKKGIGLPKAIDKLRKSSSEILKVTGVDVIYALITYKRCSGGLWEKANAALRKVMTRYPELKDCISRVLNNGHRIGDLFPEEVKEYDTAHVTLKSGSGLRESVNELRRNRLKLIKHASIDIIMALIAATRVSGDILEQAKMSLLDFITDYSEFSGCIQTVLSSGCRLDDLFSDEVKEYGLDKRPRINSESVLLTDMYAGCF